MSESKNVQDFLSLYRTYESLLRDHGTDYRTIEEGAFGKRLTIMRQMRNYLSHAEDPGFLAISPLCLEFLNKLIKEEQLKGDIVKNHLLTPAKGSIKEGTPLSKAVSMLAKRAIYVKDASLPVYNPNLKRLCGVITLEQAAFTLDAKGNLPLEESTCGPYKNKFRLLKPDEPVPEEMEADLFYCCTKDGSLASQYMGYVEQ